MLPHEWRKTEKKEANSLKPTGIVNRWNYCISQRRNLQENLPNEMVYLLRRIWSSLVIQKTAKLGLLSVQINLWKMEMLNDSDTVLIAVGRNVSSIFLLSEYTVLKYGVLVHPICYLFPARILLNKWKRFTADSSFLEARSIICTPWLEFLETIDIY